MLVLVTDYFGWTAILRDPVVESHYGEDFLVGPYREEGALWEHASGHFDVSKQSAIVPLKSSLPQSEQRSSCSPAAPVQAGAGVVATQPRRPSAFAEGEAA